jgi:hypothetical protein
MPLGLRSLALALGLAVTATGCGADAVGPVFTAQSAPILARSPLVYGNEQLARALAAARSSARVRLTVASDPAAGAILAALASGARLDDRAESYVAASFPQETVVVGRDEVGALYGALEIAERLMNEGASALPLRAPISAAPAVPIRGANLFLVLPASGDSRAWWFREERFWTEYLDLLARSRINYLDLHGMYNPDNTLCPNALPYFATSPSYPDVGAPNPEREANLRALARVVEMAKERGMKVGLMSYRSDTSLTADKEDEGLQGADLERYTREAVRDLATRIPSLARLGFRIGESGHPASWYAGTFVAGVDDAGGAAGLSTRTWLTKKPEIMELVRSTRRDTMVEAKFNGEQTGPPYPVAGGLMARRDKPYSSYSYEDYLDPPAPYTFVFHIWTGGTNRLFRYASYDRIRRTVPTTLHGGGRGFSLMAPHAFYAQHDFWHASAGDRYSPWAFRRDELEYLMFGRLGYDPRTPDLVFKSALRARAGTDALWDALQAASDIVPWIHTAHTCGPDQRWSAPELEWAGSVAFWSAPPDTPSVKKVCHTNYHGPYDIFAVSSPYDAALDLVSGRATTRISPLEVARIVLDDARRAAAAAQVPIDPNNAEARDLVREAIALSHLGEYFGHKLRGATALAVYERTGREDYLAEARNETAIADRAWEALGSSCSYIATFDEKLRMGQRLGWKSGYHWSMQKTDEDPASIDAAVRRVGRKSLAATAAIPPVRVFMDTPRGAGPGLARLDAVPGGGGRFRVSATFATPLPPNARVRILHKAFSGLYDWEATDAIGAGASFGADVALPQDAGLFAVEVDLGPGAGWRYPDALRETPYIAIPPGAARALPVEPPPHAPAPHLPVPHATVPHVPAPAPRTSAPTPPPGTFSETPRR